MGTIADPTSSLLDFYATEWRTPLQEYVKYQKICFSSLFRRKIFDFWGQFDTGVGYKHGFCFCSEVVLMWFSGNGWRMLKSTQLWIMGRNSACHCVMPGSRELEVKKTTIAMIVPARGIERLEISVVIRGEGGFSWLVWWIWAILVIRYSSSRH